MHPSDEITLLMMRLGKIRQAALDALADGGGEPALRLALQRIADAADLTPRPDPFLSRLRDELTRKRKETDR